MLTTVYSMAKNLLLYFDEINIEDSILALEGDSIELRGCGILQIMGCFIETWLLDVGNGIVTALGLVPNIIIGIGLMPAGAIIGGGYGQIHGLIVATSNDCCEDLDCKKVAGVSLKFSSCASSAVYKAWGFGNDDVSLTWNNTGGTPVTATTPTATPILTITQNANETPVRTIITSVCSNGSSRPSVPFERNLSEIVRSVIGVSLSGPTKVHPPSGTPYYYVAVGLNNPNYSTQWQVTNGTITSSSNNQAVVIWNQNMTTGSVKLVVTNNCPNGEVKQFTLSVSDGGPIP